jgi:hypothetical protein
MSGAVQRASTDTGEVIVAGVDTRRPAVPFTWNWGDGTVQEAWFPGEHTYADTERNFTVTVTAHYDDGESGLLTVEVRFVDEPPVPLPALDVAPAWLRVAVPDQPVALGGGYYPAPQNLVPLDMRDLWSLPRPVIEHALSAAAAVQWELVNGDVERSSDGTFRQVVLHNPTFGGMGSVWFSNPPAVAVGAGDHQGAAPWSSLFHELGHNVTLRSPGSLTFGGHTDGPASAIYSEALAQILQHATAHELINDAEAHGLDPSVVDGIAESARSSMRGLMSARRRYIDEGSRFESFNDPLTSEDDTFGTFMTVAAQFIVHAEQAGQGYAVPTQRMMRLLQTFDHGLLARYDPARDSESGAAFRATLMTAAISYAFDLDLRAEFSALGFPVDDPTFEELIARVP